MAEDWLADVRKYAADADEKVVAGIVRYCGIALRNRDSALVSFSDQKETGRVRDNFLKKKLGLTDGNAQLDGAIAAIGARMQADRTKNRVTVYYLLAEHFGKLAMFAGKAAGAAAPAGAVPSRGESRTAAPKAAALSELPTADDQSAPNASPAASPPATSGTVEPLAAANIGETSGASPAPRPSYATGGANEGGAYTSLDWLWLALAAVTLVLFFLR